MLTVVERVVFLTGVDVFSEVATEELSFLAAIVEEVHFIADETIYAESAPSDSMYVVVEGRVRLHRGGREVTVAAAREAFGTWALFDDEPRVTAATSLEPTRALRIDKEAFIDLLADNVQITRGVMKAIVKRLRGMLSRLGPEGPNSARSL